MLKLRNFKNQKGFTLIELMIVVAIIGILALVAVPQFQKFIAKSKQGEAKGQLKGFYTAAESIHATENSYMCGMCQWELKGKNRYEYAVSATDVVAKHADYVADVCAATKVAQTADTFEANASGNIDSDGDCDQWKIDQTGIVTSVVDDV